MGASTASTQLIFFISALVVSSIVVAVATRSVFDIASGIDDRSGIVEDQLATDIQIINDPSVVPNDPVLIYVKNVGKVTLSHELVSVMLDGITVFNATLTVTGSGSAYWEPASTLIISMDQSLVAGDHTVTVTTENGVSDKMDFRI